MTQTFAGFAYPFTFAILPRGPLSARLAEYKQTHGKRTCGPYFRNDPAPNPHGALFYLENNNFPVGAIGGIFHAQLYVFKKLGIPERLEVAAQCFFVVVIAFAGEDARL